ncbi:MAG: beta-ketoacyl-[acyl-carrier-protein] synthase family protein [Nitrospirae bacterium]|nr:beta-ketoacyl-[acyl-carrier-protein] synthase family protein [Nitrospirota bacterium]
MKPFIAGITGLGAVCSAGDSLKTIIPALYSGKRSPSAPAIFSTEIDKISPVFEVPWTLACIPTRNDSSKAAMKATPSRTSLLAQTAVMEALEHACLDNKALQGIRVGVAIGTTVGCTLNNEPFYRSYKNKKNPEINPINNFLANNPALYIAGLFNCSGPAVTIANACSSGTDAIGLAKSWIENDICDIVLAGGADELCRTTYLGFTSLLITSPEPCRPFDLNRKGLNLGEGAGIVIVESNVSAEERGIPVLGYVKGYGSSGDAHHPTAPHPEGSGLRRAIDIALKAAGVSVNDIAFINAHGTSTPDNDKVEGKVIAEMFPDSVPVVSTKAYTGHTLGAAGGIEAVFTIKALIDKQLPATAGFEIFDPECAITPTTKNRPINGTTAISNSLAFGGNNSVLVIGTEQA